MTDPDYGPNTGHQLDPRNELPEYVNEAVRDRLGDIAGDMLDMDRPQFSKWLRARLISAAEADAKELDTLYELVTLALGAVRHPAIEDIAIQRDEAAETILREWQEHYCDNASDQEIADAHDYLLED